MVVTGNEPGILHNGKHPNVYVETVNNMIVAADKRGGWPEVKKVIEQIKQKLLMQIDMISGLMYLNKDLL